MSCLYLYPQDVFINVVGGLQLREPAADVAIAVAICSRFVSFLHSYLNWPSQQQEMHDSIPVNMLVKLHGFTMHHP